MYEDMDGEEVIIQHLVMPSGIVDGEAPLYSRGGGTRDFPLTIRKGERLDLRAHFNLLPIGKLRENTDTGAVFLRLRFEGALAVHATVYGQETEETSAIPYPLDGGRCAIDCSRGDLLGIQVEAKTDSILYSGEFFCHPETTNYVHLAHIICTYHREEELHKKIEILNRFFDSDPRLDVLVVDNGRTLRGLPGKNVRLIESPNYGGSAGFARGILEARMEGKATHVILNDDDARLNPETVFRTISFYTLLKKEFSDTMLGGTMLLLERPCESSESGATFEVSHPHSLKRHLDLADIRSNIELESDEKIDYFGWWYLAMSVESVEKYGYPLPMFFKIDDVEYGLRSSSRKINMCGISVWHPSFTASYSSSGAYYAQRNILALMACHRMLNKKRVEDFFEKALLDTACLRYVSADATAKAVEDFLKGPDEMFRIHLEGPVKITGYRYEDVSELVKKIKPRKPKTAGFQFRKYSLNGVLLPSTRDMVTDFENMHTEDFYRVGKVLYTPDGKKGTLCRKNLPKAISQTLRFLSLRRKVLRNIERLNAEYSDSSARYSSEDYWRDLFNGS